MDHHICLFDSFVDFVDFLPSTFLNETKKKIKGCFQRVKELVYEKTFPPFCRFFFFEPIFVSLIANE